MAKKTKLVIPKLADVKIDPKEQLGNLDLEKVLGKKIKRIECAVSSEFGEDTLVLQCHAIVFEDGTTEFFEGEHDTAYLPGDQFEKILKSLHKEEKAEVGEDDDDDEVEADEDDADDEDEDDDDDEEGDDDDD